MMPSAADIILIIAAIGLIYDRFLGRDKDRAREKREEAKAVREEERNKEERKFRRRQIILSKRRDKKVAEVANTLETNTARTEKKIDTSSARLEDKVNTIHQYVNSYLEETQRLYAVKCREAANEKPTAVNLAEAERAEKVYENHRAQTEKMERDKQATIAAIAAEPVPNPDHGDKPITQAELKKDILETPVKVVEEMKKQGQVKPE